MRISGVRVMLIPITNRPVYEYRYFITQGVYTFIYASIGINNNMLCFIIFLYRDALW